ncbi:Uncharacterised protein [Mycobacteroides abscessus subsp. massiliense]|nr:Uncharacterised protein [Mycobacteroides abscessus subsp. massiliense]SKH91869.1 Uncharacterised protein [Mycobacteroides abscessus subsp. massiliense]SKI12473.1 Uncharacterised protein [Mycobacteroides abscessus subsp. massiliense]SKK22476.1 Uncharacterised protein [Mycobacteroides abscessus subsp. massiliense]SKK30800.1 Uncharacterised protein [Mycobacteroides abscessus subsp. massiliense]
MAPHVRKWREPKNGARAGKRYMKDEASDASRSSDDRLNQHGNQAVECGRHYAAFVRVEDLLADHIDRCRDVWSPDVRGAQEINAALSWCKGCPILLRCYREMTELRYTGLAGGTIMHRGEPIPRTSQQLNFFGDSN